MMELDVKVSGEEQIWGVKANLLLNFIKPSL